MKRFLKILLNILIFFAIYYLQLYFFDGFRIANVKPNIFIIAIVIVGLSNKPTKSFAFGVVCGTIIDILNSKVIGISAISYGLIAFFVSSVEKLFSIESRLSLILFILAGTAANEVLTYILQVLVFNSNFEFKAIFMITFIECVYNVLLTIIFYPLCKKVLKIANEYVQNNKIDNYLKKMR